MVAILVRPLPCGADGNVHGAQERCAELRHSCHFSGLQGSALTRLRSAEREGHWFAVAMAKNSAPRSYL
jgi:hypothetical protein